MPGTDPGGPAAPAGFFDDDYHRVLAPFHNEADARREAAALRELLGLAQDERVLDLGCGWGRHLALLAEAGHDVVGLDLSVALLRRARAHAHARADAPGLDLVAADMRSVPLADAAFDVVLNLATSLGLFLDDDPALAALREVHRVLRPGGRLLLEGMHRDDVVASFAPRVRWWLEDGTEVRARRRFDALSGISREVLRWRSPDGQRGEKRHALRLRTATELARLLDAASLEIEAAFGDWGGAEFRRDSERLIVLARRA